ncbi:extracellular solute-binding protein [Paenibacillus doosanensis]|uniref:Lipoprotein LipO n=1 Tax=Paenibacillus konkukensis TaxID=2020716 RepID=A0ABY4RUS4_9BACL|nr:MULTISPECIES: extracellular solute-binding protein [Paenibacillus]MCS7460303.1 extracellular solute-binding protein [Paenibacillus doosanensis]UQZ86151.1 Lipoprotein LipO precursor [Paenibacillus konkukensis]
MEKRVIKKSAAFLTLALSLAALSALSACSSSETAGTKSGGGDGAEAGAADKPFRYSTMVSTFAEVPDMKNQFWTRFQKENNLEMDVQWIPDPEFQTKLNLALASGELPDVVSAQNPDDINTLNAVEKGVFWDLDPFLGDFSQYPNLKKNIPESAWKYSKYKGTHFFIPRARSQINTGYLIRKDLLDEAGVPLPQTTDELYNALKAVKAKNPQMIGTLFMENMQSAFGSFKPQYNAEGGMYRNVLTDGYTSMVEWYRMLYKEGLMSPEFSAIKGAEPDNFFAAGKTVFHTKNFWHQYRMEQENKKIKPSAEVDIVPYITGPGGNASYLEPGYTGGLFIPKKVPEDKVKKILEVFNRAASEENSKALFYGYEGTHHKVENGKYIMTDVGLKEIQSFTNDPFSIKRNEWDKVDSPLAPVEVDLANRETVKVVYDKLTVDPFKIVRSATWAAEWPKYADEFETKRTEAIMGKITMDEYKKFIDGLRNNAALKKAFMETAQSYKEYFG